MSERMVESKQRFRTRYRLGPGALSELRDHLELASARVPILADRKVWQIYGDAVTAALAPLATTVVFLDGEEEKRLQAVERVVAELSHSRVHRRETLVVLGGGVCCDVGGMISLLYMRGMSYVIVATTLMAQLDAAIGGKVGCNAADRKSLLGGFHHPELVLIDPTFLRTLPTRHLRAALAEAVKLDLLLPELEIEPLLDSALDGEETALTELAQRCLDGKLALLQDDPFETDLRRPLNLGHAVAHALEAMPESTLLHGEAVAVGLAATARYAELKGICNPTHAAAIIARLERLGLPVRTSGDSRELRARLEQIGDHRGGKIHLVVPAGEAGTQICESCDFHLLADCAHGSLVVQ
jgi:3-dehydroquinate synthetase